MILDSKQSGVSKASSLPVRSVLPKVLDLIFDALQQMARLQGVAEEDIWWFVIDFIDAFYQIPLSRRERRLFVAKFRKQFYVWLRNAQGSKAAPLTWAIFAALAMRIAMSVVERSDAPPGEVDVAGH
jgi:hypothetical protein